MKHTTILSKQNAAETNKSAKLITANKRLAFQKKKNEKQATALLHANEELRHADEEHQKEYIRWLEEMMFMTSHRVRQPIARIIGVSTLLDSFVNSPDELKKMTGFMKQSAETLDTLTRELGAFIYEKEMRVKNKNWA